MTAYIVNTCDAWKSYESFKLVGVYTNKRKLYSAIKKMLKKDLIVNDSGYKIDELPIRELHNLLTFISIEEVGLNEAQISIV